MNQPTANSSCPYFYIKQKHSIKLNLKDSKVGRALQTKSLESDRRGGRWDSWNTDRHCLQWCPALGHNPTGTAGLSPSASGHLGALPDFRGFYKTGKSQRQGWATCTLHKSHHPSLGEGILLPPFMEELIQVSLDRINPHSRTMISWKALPI